MEIGQSSSGCWSGGGAGDVPLLLLLLLHKQAAAQSDWVSLGAYCNLTFDTKANKRISLKNLNYSFKNKFMMVDYSWTSRLKTLLLGGLRGAKVEGKPFGESDIELDTRYVAWESLFLQKDLKEKKREAPKGLNYNTKKISSGLQDVKKTLGLKKRYYGKKRCLKEFRDDWTTIKATRRSPAVRHTPKFIGFEHPFPCKADIQ